MNFDEYNFPALFEQHAFDGNQSMHRTCTHQLICRSTYLLAVFPNLIVRFVRSHLTFFLTRMQEPGKRLCEACLTRGTRTELVPFHLNFEEAIFLCKEESTYFLLLVWTTSLFLSSSTSGSVRRSTCSSFLDEMDSSSGKIRHD